ncbi:hypothetical protein KR032_000668, partial [Drosophila birchii]
AMRVPILFLLNFFILYVSSVHASFFKEDEQDTQYMRQLLRLAKAAEIKSFMNITADPCSNFYEFACGNYKHINPAKVLNVASTGSFQTLQKGLNRKLQKILSTQQDSHDTPEDVQVKRFYESCTRIELNTYTQQLKDLIFEFGSMPVLVGDFWREEDFNWLDTTGRIAHRYGIRAIIQVFSLDYEGVLLRPPKIILKASYKSHLQKIESILEKILDVESSLAKQTAREVLDFDVNLSRGIVEGKESFELFVVGEDSPPISDVNRLLNVTFVGTKNIFVKNIFYIQHLNEVIKSVPQRIVANYIFYYLIQDFIDSFPLYASSSCVDLTRKHIPKSLENMFYRRNKKAASDIENVWHQIRDAFNRTLFSPQLNWIKPPTQKAAYDKLQKMKLNILSYEGVNFTQKFEGLNLTNSNYLENLRQVKMFFAVRRAAEVRGDNHYSPTYILDFNTIYMPVAFLQHYYFWADAYPKALLFGTMGSFLGHELIHGFSCNGCNDGGFNDWWDPLSSRNYLERESCFKEQYEHYADKLNSDQNENIADNGGLSLALAAYKEWSKRQNEMDSTERLVDNEQLPSLNFTAKQLFFLSFAQKNCMDIDNDAVDVLLTPDNHAPESLRVIGSLSNIHDFSHEFNCPEGSPMNPKKKCRIY